MKPASRTRFLTVPNSELFPDPLAKIDQAPTHDGMGGGDRAAFDHLYNRRACPGTRTVARHGDRASTSPAPASAKPSKPLRMSVCPAASHTRTPAGTGIIAHPEPRSPVSALPSPPARSPAGAGRRQGRSRSHHDQCPARVPMLQQPMALAMPPARSPQLSCVRSSSPGIPLPPPAEHQARGNPMLARRRRHGSLIGIGHDRLLLRLPSTSAALRRRPHIASLRHIQTREQHRSNHQ